MLRLGRTLLRSYKHPVDRGKLNKLKIRKRLWLNPALKLGLDEDEIVRGYRAPRVSRDVHTVAVMATSICLPHAGMPLDRGINEQGQATLLPLQSALQTHLHPWRQLPTSSQLTSSPINRVNRWPTWTDCVKYVMLVQHIRAISSLAESHVDLRNTCI